MHKYKKRPVTIEAFQMTKERRWDNSEWPEWLHAAWQRDPIEQGIVGENAVWPNPDAPPNPEHKSADELVCGTPEGVHIVTFGDYIIKGVQGELYPVKENIFLQTYEKV